MRPWASLHGHSNFSILDSTNRPATIIETCIKNGITSCALTDHGSLAGIAPFLEAKKTLIEKYAAIGKKGNQEVKDRAAQAIEKVKQFKQIFGCELNISKQDSTIRTRENGKHSHLVVLAKNQQGWKDLLRLTTESNREHNFYAVPRLSLPQLSPFAKENMIALSGHPGSDLANVMFLNCEAAYAATTYDEAKSFIDPNWKKNCFKVLDDLQSIFGKENVFIEIQRFDEELFPAAKVIANGLTFIGKKTGIKLVATADFHYATREHSVDHNVVLCKDTTFENKHKKRMDENDYVGVEIFFRSNNYHIPTVEEMNKFHTDEELDNSIIISDMCETYNIFYPPSVPTFEYPNGWNCEEYLRHLCREGFKQKTRRRGLEENPYVERIKEELAVFHSFDVLEKYFLIVHDYVNAARSRGEIVGPGRGSSAGCLTTYYLGITAIDPILRKLSFSRFYNAGRNSKDHVSIPDVDTDFQIDKREDTINYCRNKFGNGRVCQIGTFARMMGSSAIQNVFRVHDALSADEVLKITEWIPDEAEISDALQHMREDGEEPSIIKWALRHNKEKLRDYCSLDGKDKLVGQFASLFAQAIRLEGTIQSTSKHASGVIITDFDLEERIPLIKDKSSDNLITGCDMHAVEKFGGVKFDILGLANLDTLQDVTRLLRTGTLE